jgi:hypothetical protein
MVSRLYLPINSICALLTLAADAHPEAEVIGVDLSPVQPELYVKPSMTFYHDILSNLLCLQRPPKLLL